MAPPVLEIITCLDFVHHLMFLKTRFRNWMFLSSGKMMGVSTLLGLSE
jgi:hypothetical protein